jgi:hypothetical protein
MRRQFTGRTWARMTSSLLFCGVLCAAASAGAQVGRPREHIVLPPTWGATPQSTIIEAQARYVAAWGDMQESVAIAREIHADAFAKEIQNSVEYAKAFWERRRIYREAKAAENPNYAQWQKKNEELIDEYIRRNVKPGDTTKTLNWLLSSLYDLTMADQYSAGRGNWIESDLNPELSDKDLEQIILCDRGGKGARLRFAASDGAILATRWPYELSGPTFEKARQDFEQTRDEFLREARQSQKPLGDVQGKFGPLLFQRVDVLLTALRDAYPDEVRKEFPVWDKYNEAAKFLKTLALETNRAVRTHDRRVFTSGLGISAGNAKHVRLMDLIAHVYREGLAFAPPEPGGEGAYWHLYQMMRKLYIDLGPEPSHETKTEK